MGYSKKMTSLLTGATPNQLESWRKSGLVRPEVRNDRPPLWSFRDLVLLRSVAYLRSQLSSQKIHKGFDHLRELQQVESAPDVAGAAFAHPSEYEFGTDGRTIFLGTPGGEGYDLLKKVTASGAQPMLFPASVMLEAFSNFKGSEVAPLRAPSKYLELDPGRMGGVPTIVGTRVPFDVIARLVDYKTVFPGDVSNFYPSVSPAAAEDARAFSDRIESVAG